MLPLSGMEDDRDEINLLDYLDVLKKRGRMILIMVSVSVVLAAVISLLLHKKYSAHAVIIPVSESRSGTDRMSALAMQLEFRLHHRPMLPRSSAC